VAVVAVPPFRRWYSLEKPNTTSFTVMVLAVVVMATGLIVADRWGRAGTAARADRAMHQ
jgi:hypothetical protein